MILMSGWTERVDIDADLFFEVIHKPFAIDVLVKLIGEALAK